MYLLEFRGAPEWNLAPLNISHTSGQDAPLYYAYFDGKPYKNGTSSNTKTRCSNTVTVFYLTPVWKP